MTEDVFDPTPADTVIVKPTPAVEPDDVDWAAAAQPTAQDEAHAAWAAKDAAQAIQSPPAGREGPSQATGALAQARATQQAIDAAVQRAVAEHISGLMQTLKAAPRPEMQHARAVSMADLLRGLKR